MRSAILDVGNSFPFYEVSIGYRAVTLFAADELEEAQIGYSIDINGQFLTGTGDGDWYSSWRVIGNKDETGDPIFIDSKRKLK
jgi:hypothetical protein